MKSILSVLFLGIASLSFAQGFYDLDKVQTIEITFTENNWDQILDAAYASGAYTLAASVRINGVPFDSVGVKYKGNSTYNPNQAKNPLHIELDTYKSQDYQGYQDIKLSNGSKDPSMLREVLSYQILRNYMVAPLSNYANVYVNGELLGLYSNTESITKRFTKSRFDSKGNTFVKCNPPAGAGPQTNDFPNLAYLGEDSTAYYEAYELKTDYGWSDLIDLCDTLKNATEAIAKILDVDKTLWMLAYNNVLVNLDSYSGAFSQNYYLYKDDYGRFLPIVWDLNESFGRFAMTGSSNLNSTTSKQQMNHLLHEDDSSFPLIQKLLEVPMYKRMYLAHFKTIFLENFTNGSYYDTGLMLQASIEESVQADNNYLFTYSNFLNNLDNDISSGGPGPMGGSVPGIASLMNGRATYLSGLSDFLQPEPDIVSTSLSSIQPIIGDVITVNATVENGNRVFIGFRNERNAPFTRIEMFDDGAHNDMEAGDGIFGTELLIDNAFIQYYVYAENDSIGKFHPVRAEHEFLTITATTGHTELGDLVINEFMASNEATVADQYGEYDDWIEIYNNGDSSYDLEGYFLSDDAEDLMKWTFPASTTLEAHSYLLIWADDDTEQEGIHASFKLSASAESIFLTDPNGVILDEVSYTDQSADISYGRYPNGTGDFRVMTPTFGTENTITTSVIGDASTDARLSIYPNPATEFLFIKNKNKEVRHITIYRMNGDQVFEIEVEDEATIDTADWATGLYFLKCNDKYYKLLIW